MELSGPIGGRRAHRMTGSRGLKGQVQGPELDLEEERNLELSRNLELAAM